MGFPLGVEKALGHRAFGGPQAGSLPGLGVLQIKDGLAGAEVFLAAIETGSLLHFLPQTMRRMKQVDSEVLTDSGRLGLD